MRPSAATVGVLLGLALLFSSCGGDGKSTVGKSASTAAATSQAGASAGDPCRRRLRGFLGTMATLRDKLARGLSYDDYLGEVRRIRAAYARIHAAELPAGCLVASAGPGEHAFNLYIDAANAWGDCLATVSCNTRSIEPRLQHKWALASDSLSLAQRGLGS
jgi:hypothetical protein